MSEGTRAALSALVDDLHRHLDWVCDNSPEVLQERRPVRPPARPVGQAARAAAAAPKAARQAGPGVPQLASSQICAASRTTVTATTLEGIRDELGECVRCKLHRGRKKVVFGVGNPAAELVFVGEGPGPDEDEQGEPFVGAAGQLLDRMIAAIGFARPEVYIGNVVKCLPPVRPPHNRFPEPDEIAACAPFLHAQLDALRPKVVVALGKCAAQTLLGGSAGITALRGSWREWRGVPVMPTFHPAYLLRSPQEKRKAWEDLQQVMRRFPERRRAAAPGNGP